GRRGGRTPSARREVISGWPRWSAVPCWVWLRSRGYIVVFGEVGRHHVERLSAELAPHALQGSDHQRDTVLSAWILYLELPSGERCEAEGQKTQASVGLTHAQLGKEHSRPPIRIGPVEVDVVILRAPVLLDLLRHHATGHHLDDTSVSGGHQGDMGPMEKLPVLVP